MNDPFKYKLLNDKQHIWDEYRKKYVQLTKEEWVRQNILFYLVSVKKYPASLISVEKQILVGNTRKRYDAVVYRNDKPWLLLECKAENEVLEAKSLQQILAYKSVLAVSYLSITNGKEVHTYSIDAQSWMQGFPEYEAGIR
jgi:hypothetical protein